MIWRALETVVGIVVYFTVVWYCQRKSYQRGYDQGFRDGVEEFSGWMLKHEAEVDQARQEIWRAGK